ncbi:preprotein translocase subunit YajC [Hyphobacterium sp.]|uniref:preprotein translocase subunit YajC n=1 Tax=Hyphobacterium sp. TaxID=2004662 RepID=UPI003BA95A5E
MFDAIQIAAASGGSGGAMAALIQFAPLILIFVVFYFLLIRPQQKRMKEHREMVAALSKGDEVVTSGGILGKVTKVDDAEAQVEIATGVKVRVMKATISEVRSRTQPKAANDAKADKKTDKTVSG